MKKPKVKAPMSKDYQELAYLMELWGLNTVCQEAACPNIGECWAKRTATFMLLGDTCTRACRFCNIKTGKPKAVDPKECETLAKAVKHLNLQHVVITSVTRDDLKDGGAQHFANTITEIRKLNPLVTIEILTPDFLNKGNCYEVIVKSKPDVFNHNLETVPRLYRSVRLGARYYNSLRLLDKVKEKDPTIFTKSGIMVGLGESRDEVLQLMDDLIVANVDFFTIGQYLQPTEKHHPVIDYVNDETFKFYEMQAKARGFKMVSASALTRSSYHADEHFNILKKSNF